MEKYIFTFEDGSHSISYELTEDDKQSVLDGYLSIIRCSDAKILSTSLDWKDLPELPKYNSQ